MPRGLDPVLIAGTQGEFDPWIQFVNMPLELVMEQWWVQRKLNPSYPTPAYPVLCSKGSPETWRELCPITPLENAVVATETANSEWVALTFLVPRRQRSTSEVIFAATRGVVNSQPLAVNIFYDLRSDDSYLVKTEFEDARYPYGKLRSISRQRFLGKFDFTEVGPRLDYEDGLEYTGRGWKMFNHDDLHTITGNLGIDLRDPGFLIGTCAFMEEAL